MIFRLLTPFRIAVVAALALSVLRFEGCLYMHLTDMRVMDYRLLQRGPIATGPEVVILAVDDASIAEVGRWPWPRTVIAQLLTKILEADPAVVAFDVVFSEPSSFEERPGLQLRPPDLAEDTWQAAQAALVGQDERLANVIRDSGRTVLGYFLQFDEGSVRSDTDEEIPYLSAFDFVKGSRGEKGETQVKQAPGVRANIELLNDAARETGFFNVFPDPNDGSVRRAPLALRYGFDIGIPLSLATLRVFAPDASLRLKFDELGIERLTFGDREIPVGRDGHLLINYRGPGKTFPHVSAGDVLFDRQSPDALRDKIVLVGVTATAVADVRVVPFDEVFPGVEIHANVIDNVLRGDFLRRPRVETVLYEIGTIIFLVFLVGVALHYLRGVAAALTAAGILGAYLVVSQGIFVRYGLPLSVVYPLMAIGFTYASIALQHYVTEEREKRKVRKALDLYLSPSMAKLVSEQPERLKLGGEKRELTVFFSDIRGFTNISERLEPEELVELLNAYLGDMTDIIFRYDGMLDKYIGDAVMAVWGAPLPQADHAARACLATIEMTRRLDELNANWKDRGWPPLAIGAGLNTGPMVFGNMGSSQHLSLTVMGDEVNLGSRLEGLNKTYGTTIIASEATLRAAPDVVVARELDLVRVKGKELPVRIFEILGPVEERDRWSERTERFAAGVHAYRAQRWAQADKEFQAVLAEWPDDGPSSLYFRRCVAMQANPPGPDWDAVTIMETK